MEIDEIIDTIYPLTSTSKDLIKKSILQTKLPKGHTLFKANKIETRIYFIKKGIARAYAYSEDNQITFWFGKEGDPIVSMQNYVNNQKGYEDVELLEDCELYELKTEKLQKLFLEDIQIANWGRKFSELELIKSEERLISLQFNTATERYLALLKNYPSIIQRVQLSHIASYLGITQVSLSRIRAKLK
ncbi:Crp/Fnr family transcriptional regulator [Ulvibacter litoralis]|uniref:cAMP-binding domain of CRP or a regulatory subunit of cAMP-dependent protein kinases n=1 Tax=Ulvibacter litoralis TaxID=227084 RepID=A0A1G7H1T3_9FLAO|nr:Crp/Fnr family transcriptional regulator [Ulvibacter litoralis]GHC59175.1 cyclic nucleotide-binding protein [Ulvibacter litoralis]SDE94388.1 cAMP-binding domain of CRP or a regulatory subunit of cAMP-dependent protein kinases [Ulvibacter litoralis]